MNTENTRIYEYYSFHACKSAIARYHGGNITLTSQVNKGSCFQVRIPVLAQKVEIKS